MPAAAVFSTYFLQYAQTFVYDELRNHERYDVEVFCRKRMNVARFPFDRVHVAGPGYGVTLRDRAFERALATGRFALLHAHFGPGGVYALRFATKLRLPLVVTFHGYDVPILSSPARFLPKSLRYALLGPAVLRAMTLGLCASAELLEMLAALGVPRERLRLHHIGIDVERFAAEPRAPGDRVEVVMVGRFVEKKGFEYGLRAFARVANRLPSRLTLIGDGHLAGRLRALAKELGIEDRVVFSGVLTSSGVAERLRQSDVLMAPSVVGPGGDRESGILSVKEASASSVVPIGTVHGGIPEIIEDGVTGFLVPERDVDALADRLFLVASDPALRATLGRAARAKMLREYDVRTRVRALETHYDDAIRIHVGRA